MLKMKLTKEEIEIYIFSTLIAIFVALVLTFIQPYWGLSLLMGFLVSLFNFWKTSYVITYILSFRLQKPRLSMFINQLINYILYAIIIYINFIIPIFNFIVALAGLFIVKIAVFIVALKEGKSKVGELNEHKTNC